MMRRRFFIGASLGLAAGSAGAQERPVRFSITGSMEQGSLAMGSAPPGSLVALDGRPLHALADGRFAFGFAPNQTSPSVVTVRYPDGGGDSRSCSRVALRCVTSPSPTRPLSFVCSKTFHGCATSATATFIRCRTRRDT